MVNTRRPFASHRISTAYYFSRRNNKSWLHDWHGCQTHVKVVFFFFEPFVSSEFFCWQQKNLSPTKPWPLWPDKSLTCFTWDRWGKLCGLQAVRMLILKDFFKKIHWSRRSNTSSRFDMKIPHEGGWGSSHDSSTMWWFLSHFWQEELKIDLCMFLNLHCFRISYDFICLESKIKNNMT